MNDIVRYIGLMRANENEEGDTTEKSRTEQWPRCGRLSWCHDLTRIRSAAPTEGER
jgi:hypothetical protein